MGQQQLLLVILVTIIVGIATVVAINTFSSAADSANIDAVRQDVASIAAAAQGYYMKPKMLGGGGKEFDNLTFKGMAIPGNIDASSNSIITNQNGTYEITSASGDELKVTATPSSIKGYTAGESANEADGALFVTIKPNDMVWGS